ncbi:MAG: hypothetical protein P8020_20615 [Acidobacteriota bacterium]
MKDGNRRATVEGEGRRIVLSGELTVQRATILFEDISDVDLSFLQILHAVRTACETMGRTLEIGGERPELVDRAIDRAGLLRGSCGHDGLG